MHTIEQLKRKADRANRVHVTLSPVRQRNLPETEEYLIDRLHHLAGQGNYQTDVTFSNWEDEYLREIVNRLKKGHNLVVETTDSLLTYRLRWDV
jgi:rRNA-processing protein FCF1